MFKSNLPAQPAERAVSKGSDFSSLYNHSMSVVNPQATAFVKNDNYASIFFKIKSNELRNAVANPNCNNISLLVKYSLRRAENFSLVDSCTTKFDFYIDSANYVVGQIELKLAEKASYKLILDFSNPLYKINKRLLLNVNNLPDNNDTKFLITNANEEILFTNVATKNQDVIIYANSSSQQNISIEYYKQQPYVMFPPYLLVQGRMRTDPVANANGPDTIFNYTCGNTLTLEKPGFYALGTTAKNEKFGIVVTDNDNYPNIASVEAMKEPLKLLCSEKEYKMIDTAEDVKFAIDAFWLGLSKSEKSAKEQIRIFYNRLAKANIFFANTIEGWKTDRGMIYILLGPPSIVNITKNTEEWTYGDIRSGINFTFYNYSGLANDYSLERANTYQSVWQQVVSTWRLGKIFTITKIDNE